MIGPTLNLLNSLSQELTVKEALSGVFGSISLATWITLLVPQLMLNYTNQKAESLSLYFLFAWLGGDIANVSGATWAKLVPTVIALGAYFCVADLVLITQVLYYNEYNGRKEHKQQRGRRPRTADPDNAAEDSPLLTDGAAEQEVSRLKRSGSGLPGSIRRESTTSNWSGFVDGPNKDSFEHNHPILHFILYLGGVIAAGSCGWMLAYFAGVWRPVPETGPVGPGDEVAIGAEVLGYLSAVLYLGARIPQIWKNQREKSTEGLSLAFFALSMMGNSTYGAGILFHSLDKQYVMANLPWLIGSLGTILQDAFVFYQFMQYSFNKEKKPSEAATS